MNDQANIFPFPAYTTGMYFKIWKEHRSIVYCRILFAAALQEPAHFKVLYT